MSRYRISLPRVLWYTFVNSLLSLTYKGCSLAEEMRITVVFRPKTHVKRGVYPGNDATEQIRCNYSFEDLSAQVIINIHRKHSLCMVCISNFITNGLNGEKMHLSQAFTIGTEFGALFVANWFSYQNVSYILYGIWFCLL